MADSFSRNSQCLTTIRAFRLLISSAFQSVRSNLRGHGTFMLNDKVRQLCLSRLFITFRGMNLRQVLLDISELSL